MFEIWMIPLAMFLFVDREDGETRLNTNKKEGVLVVEKIAYLPFTCTANTKLTIAFLGTFAFQQVNDKLFCRKGSSALEAAFVRAWLGGEIFRRCARACLGSGVFRKCVRPCHVLLCMLKNFLIIQFPLDRVRQMAIRLRDFFEFFLAFRIFVRAFVGGTCEQKME